MLIKSLSATQKNIIISVGFLILAVVAYYLSGVIAPFLISLVAAHILNPLVNKLVEKKVPRPWAVLIIFSVAFIVFTIIIVPFTLSMFSDAGDLITKLGTLDVNRITDNFKELGNEMDQKFSAYPSVRSYIDEFVHSDKIRELAAQSLIIIKDGAVAAFKRIIGFFGTAFSGMVNMFLIPILIFYILLDLDAVYQSFKSLLPPDYRDRVISIAAKVDDGMSKLLIGQLFANSIFAFLMTIGIWISGLNFVLFLGLFSGLANFIPYLGGLFTVVFAVFIAIAQFGFSSALLAALIKVVIVIAIIQTIDAWYLQPHVVGDNAGLHPLIVMLALAIAANIAGIPGMILAVPVTVILKVLGRELYHELYDTGN